MLVDFFFKFHFIYHTNESKNDNEISEKHQVYEKFTYYTATGFRVKTTNNKVIHYR